MNAGQATGELARLIDTELALEAKVTGAKAEADRIVALAREQAAAAERDLEASLEGSRARFQAELDDECRCRSNDVMERGRQEAGRFDRFAAADVERLAGLVLRRMVEGT